MSTMAREIKKLKGRDTFLSVQEDLDNFMKAKGYRAREDANTEFLRQLYYGMNMILETIEQQDMKIEKLLHDLSSGMRPAGTSRNVKVRRHHPVRTDLSQAIHLIESNRDLRGRITWSKMENPKDLIFAYLRKAESEGVNIDHTMEVQEIPQYRRVFQYVVYNIGSWKDIVSEYRSSRYCSAVSH